MTDTDRRQRIHELDATLRVGKNGPAAVADELRSQLDDRGLVKAKFLRSALGGTDADAVAAELADMAGAEVVETRGHTAVFE